MRVRGKSVGKKVFVLVALASSVAWAASYVAGTASSSATLQFGIMQTAGLHTSVPGTRADGGVNAWAFDATGNVLDGSGDLGRVFMYDAFAAADLADGQAVRGQTNFAMMIWDFGRSVNFVRIYPMVDHGTPLGPNVDEFGGSDMVAQSLWGSNDGDNFTLISDITAIAPGGVNGQTPTYTFTGADQPIVYRGGSAEFGAVNGYTRDYTLGTAYRYFGIRASTLRQTMKNNLVNNNSVQDSDPEIDAIATVPPPPSGGNGLTPGFWHNKNGQRAIANADPSPFAGLQALCLVNKDGTAFNPTTAAQIGGWIQSDATNMAYKLSTMLAAMYLNVNVPVKGKSVDPNALVYTWGWEAELGVAQISIADLMAAANADLCTAGHNLTIEAGAVRTHQSALKDVLDWANNNLNWVP